MPVRKHLSGSQRRFALGYGVACILIALVIAQIETFQWGIAIAFVIGLFGVGGVVRSVMGYDEL